MQIPYGKTSLNFNLPDNVTYTVLEPKKATPVADAKAEVMRAINEPIGGKRLEDIKGAQSVCIVISDITRPVPNKEIMPPLIQKLEEIGITRDKITIMVAPGLHRPATPEEFEILLGPEIAKTVKVVSHNARETDKLEYLGNTKRGTPIWVNKDFLNAEAKILTGLVQPHQFVGFSGGLKTVTIGLAGEETIKGTHIRLTDPMAKMGVMKGNPVREDVDDIAEFIDVDFIVNVVTDDHKQIIKAFAGHPIEAHYEATKLAGSLSEVEVEKEADVVITSAGGFPKDINLYQAQKAVMHAEQVVKKGGTIILVAECVEGIGSDGYYKRMSAAKDAQEIMDVFPKEEFKIGPHKAFLFARSIVKAEVLMLSSLDPDLVKLMKLIPISSLQDAIDNAIAKAGTNPHVIIMPQAGATIPCLKGSK